MNRLAILGFLSFFISGNDVFFDEIQDMGNNEISINFNLDKVSLVRSYSLENPSRIVMEINQSSLPTEINVPYNYPIKKVRASQDGSLTRIVVDLYESVHWQNPTQTINTENIKLKLKVKRNKNLNKSIRDIVVAIDAGHGGKYPGAVGPNNILEKESSRFIYSSFFIELQKIIESSKTFVKGS